MNNETIKLKFAWKDKDNNYHQIHDMETRHLFYILKMIWNHSMQDDFKLKPYKKYYFSDFYTEKYMIDAVRSILPELLMRNDLDDDWKYQLDFMQDCLIKLHEREKLVHIKTLPAGSR